MQDLTELVSHYLYFDVSRLEDVFFEIDFAVAECDLCFAFCSIESLSELINQWFEALSADHSSVDRELSGLANSMSAIHESIAELRKGNEELKQRIDAAQSQLQAIAKDVSGLKIATKKQVAKQRKHVAAKPPFHIDAIDLWDDALYVAISQDGRVTFLREGEQRSGWNVTHIDRAKGQVAFRGPAGQDYSASLRR